MASTPTNYTWGSPTFTWASAEASKTWATAQYYSHTVDPAEAFSWSDSLGNAFTKDIDEASWGNSDAFKFTHTGAYSESWANADGYVLASTVALSDTWATADEAIASLHYFQDAADGWGHSDSVSLNATVAPDETVAFAPDYDRLVDFNTDWAESWSSTDELGNHVTIPISEASWGNSDAWSRLWVADHELIEDDLVLLDDGHDELYPVTFDVDSQLDDGWDTAEGFVDAATQPREFADGWGTTDSLSAKEIELGFNEGWDTATAELDYVNANTLSITEETLWFNQTVSTWTNATGAWQDRGEDWLNLFEVAPTSFEALITLGVLATDGWGQTDALGKEITKSISETAFDVADDFAYVNLIDRDLGETLDWSEALKFTLDGPHLTDGWGISDGYINAMYWADPAPSDSFNFSDGSTLQTLVDRGVPVSDGWNVSDGFSYLLENVAARAVLSDTTILDIPIDADGFDQLMTYSSPPGFSEWQLFAPGDYDYQQAYIRLRIDPTEIGQSPQFTKTAVVADVPDVTDGGNAAVSGQQLVSFNRTFHEPPDVVAMMTGGSTWATANIVSITTTGFTVELLTKQGNTTNGTVNWQAEGY